MTINEARTVNPGNTIIYRKDHLKRIVSSIDQVIVGTRREIIFICKRGRKTESIRHIDAVKVSETKVL